MHKSTYLPPLSLQTRDWGISTLSDSHPHFKVCGTSFCCVTSFVTSPFVSPSHLSHRPFVSSPLRLIAPSSHRPFVSSPLHLTSPFVMLPQVIRPKCSPPTARSTRPRSHWCRHHTTTTARTLSHELSNGNSQRLPRAINITTASTSPASHAMSSSMAVLSVPTPQTSRARCSPKLTTQRKCSPQRLEECVGEFMS